jgi:hypothetical protein
MPDRQHDSRGSGHAVVIDAAEMIVFDGIESAQQILFKSPVQPQVLARAALNILAGIMGGDGAAARFDEMRSEAHQVALRVGAHDHQVRLSLEIASAAQAIDQGDMELANSIAKQSEFTAYDYAYAATSWIALVIRGWIGQARAQGFLQSMRREYGAT